jgi:methylase of polypeptide subunit release factors
VRFADVGTGSGCLAVALAIFASARLIATDISGALESRDATPTATGCPHGSTS